MEEKEKTVAKNSSKKNLLGIIRDLLHQEEPEMEAPPASPAEEIVERLIDKAVGESASDDSKNQEDSKGDEDPEGANDSKNEGDSEDESDDSDKGEKKGCPYATKKAIVESLKEIREFAEKHHLKETVIKALLTMLAQIALGALKGKVSGKVLDTLLKAFNYEKALREAYMEGEIAGRNATIREEIFPELNQDVPDLNGVAMNPVSHDSIFELARQAKN